CRRGRPGARQPWRGAGRELRRRGGGLRRALGPRAPPPRGGRRGRAVGADPERRYRLRRHLQLGRVRRLPDRRQPRPSHRRHGAGVVRAVHAGLRPLDDRADRLCRGRRLARGGHRGPRHRRGAARPCGCSARLEDAMSPARPRPVLETVPLYAPDPTPVELDLSDNVNLWGVPPAAARALADPLAARPSVYPRSDPRELRVALARYAGVSAAQVVTGCGSDDVIDGALRAFAAPGEKVAYSAPSFSMLVTFARVNGLEPAPVPFRRDGDVDPDALLAERAAVTYVCNPNNPTGTGVSSAALERVVAKAEGLVLVDEAYGEFSGRTSVPLLARAPQLLVTRTLSKAFGLAGLRVGYGLAAPEVVQVLEKVRGPYKVNVLGERAALAALGDDLPWVRRHVEASVAIRERLRVALETLGFRALPSAANFLCVPVPDAAALGRALLGQ